MPGRRSELTPAGVISLKGARRDARNRVQAGRAGVAVEEEGGIAEAAEAGGGRGKGKSRKLKFETRRRSGYAGASLKAEFYLGFKN